MILAQVEDDVRMEAQEEEEEAEVILEIASPTLRVYEEVDDTREQELSQGEVVVSESDD